MSDIRKVYVQGEEFHCFEINETIKCYIDKLSHDELGIIDISKIDDGVKLETERFIIEPYILLNDSLLVYDKLLEKYCTIQELLTYCIASSMTLGCTNPILIEKFESVFGKVI